MGNYARVKDGNTKLQFVCSDDLKAQIQERADQEQTTMTAILIAASERYLKTALPRKKKQR